MRPLCWSPLLALVAAGCVAPDPGLGGEPGGDVPEALELGACDIQEIIFSVAPESLRDHLPDGFVPEAFPAEGRAGLLALSIRCTAPEPTLLGMVIIPLASAPEGLNRENASAQGIVTSIVIDKGERTRSTLEAWGFGPALSPGTVTVEDVLASPAEAVPRVGKTTVETAEGGRFVIDTNVRGIPRTDEGNFLRFWVVHDRQVIGTFDCDLTGNHRIHSGEAHMEARGYAPLPDGTVAGLGFHESSEVQRWTRVP